MMPFGQAAWWGQRAFQWRDARKAERVRREFWRKARRVAARLPFAEDLLAAYYCAFDRATPVQARSPISYSRSMRCPTCYRSSVSPTTQRYCSRRYAWLPGTCVRSIARRRALRSRE